MLFVIYAKNKFARHVFETRNRQNLTGAGRRTKKRTIYKAHIKRVRATAFFSFWYSITVHFFPKNLFSFQFIGHRKPVIIKQLFILIRKDFWFNKLINNLWRVFGIKDPTLMPTTKTTEGTERLWVAWGGIISCPGLPSLCRFSVDDLGSRLYLRTNLGLFNSYIESRKSQISQNLIC